MISLSFYKSSLYSDINIRYQNNAYINTNVCEIISRYVIYIRIVEYCLVKNNIDLMYILQVQVYCKYTEVQK